MCRQYEAHLEAEAEAWAETPEGRAAAEAERAEMARREAEAARREDRERVLRRKHPREWAQWERVQLLWGQEPLDMTNLGAKPYDFADFLAEVGPDRTGRRRVERINERLPFEPGNLTWVDPPAGALPAEVVERLLATSSPYLNYQHAAAYTGDAVKTLQNAKSAGELRAVGGGGRVAFDRAELDRWKRNGR